MKKKIAIFGNAWSVEYLKVVMKGIRKSAKENNVDLFCFMNYTVTNDSKMHDIGEANIFRLSEHMQFDGYIFLSNTFHLETEFDFVKKRFAGTDIPAVSLEYNIPGIQFCGSENYSGMYEMCEHVIKDHGARNIMYISGPVEHAENIERRKALEDCMHKYGLKLTEDDVLVCNWNITEVEVKFPVWMQNRSVIPDAVICANDMMAMGACSVIEKIGYKIPEDVIVTGFDHLRTAEAFSPAIASVERDWTDLGYKAVEYLVRRIGGEKVDNLPLVKSRAVPNESCGCTSKEVVDAKMQEIRNSYNNYLSRANTGIYVCYLADFISKAVSEKELRKTLMETEWNSQYEGDEFYICLTNDFFTSIKTGIPLEKTGYTDMIDVIYGHKDGKQIDRMMMHTSELIPGYCGESEEVEIYLFLPIYGEEGCYGYAAFASELNILYDYSLYSWIRHMNIAMRYVRRGIMMNRVSVTDPLTGVYNRIGCEKKAYPFLEECHKQGRWAALMFADINRMKLINDNYGHLQGDMAIRIVARAIVDVLQDDWIVVRYGGDEFLMVGECKNATEAAAKQEEILNRLEEIKAESNLPYKLKVSLGHMMVSPDEEFEMSETLTRAENEMYAMKKKLHEETQE